MANPKQQPLPPLPGAPPVPPNMARALTKDLPTGMIAQHIAAQDQGVNAKLDALINLSQSNLSKAQSIVDNAVVGEVWKVAKPMVQSLLAPAKDVIAVLDVVSQIHPAVAIAVGVFKVIVKLEMDRQDNDKHIAVLYFTMTNLMSVLSFLSPVFNAETGLKASLEKQLKDMCDTMNSFGNFCDVYYKHRGIVRMVLSSKYKAQLTTFASNFTEQKADLVFLTQQHTAVQVTEMNTSLTGANAKIDRILAFIEVQSPKEKEMEVMIRDKGGEDVVANNDEMLAAVAKAMGEEVTSAVKLQLRTDLDDVLKSNMALYNLKVETATAQIKEAIELSTETILVRLDSGPHDLIDDPDIRAIWKDMNWRVSCKCRHFVDAVHHYYSQVFARHQLITGEIHPDKWTLKFMAKVIYYPAIGDAIDEDGSGYISVYETNRFFRHKPVHWTSPQWISYWAAGWYQNAIAYKYRCEALMDTIEAEAKKTLPANLKILKKWYLSNDEGAIKCLRLIVESVYTDTFWYHGEKDSPGGEFTELDKLRKERMTEEINRMKLHLAKPKYQLDSIAAVQAIAGTSQTEVTVLCLAYVILRRHRKIIELAQTKVLSEAEFSVMYSTLDNITSAFGKRFNNLLECWRQQRLDIKQQLECFAGGMYEQWHKEYYESDDEDGYDSDDSSTSSSSAESSEAKETISFDTEKVAAHENWEDDPEDSTELLIYPLPAQPQPNVEAATAPAAVAKAENADPGSDSDSSSSSDKKPKKLSLVKRVALVETKLEGIEKLLQEVLKITKSIAEKSDMPSTSKGKSKTAEVKKEKEREIVKEMGNEPLVSSEATASLDKPDDSKDVTEEDGSGSGSESGSGSGSGSGSESGSDSGSDSEPETKKVTKAAKSAKK